MPDLDRTPTTTSAGNTRSAFWPTVFLVLSLVAVKATYVKLSAFWTWATPKDYVSLLYARWLASMSLYDVKFGVAEGVIAAAALFLARRNARLSKFVWLAFVAYVWLMWRKLGAVEQDLSALATQIARGSKADSK